MNWRRGREEEDRLDKELKFHVEERVADLVRAGLGEAEARRRVRLEFGGIEQVKEECRDARLTGLLDTIGRDVRIAARALRRSPGFAIAAVSALALAIGANTAIFSLISFTLLEPLPYPDAGRLVQFWFATPGGASLTLSVPVINALARETSLFDGIAAYDFGGPGVNITGVGEPEQVQAIHASAGYFQLFGARIAAGRTFTEDEDRPNGGRVVVLSHRLWQRRFGGDPSLVGRTISLGNEPHTVVGVLGPDFRPDPPAQIWFPLQTDAEGTGQASYLRAAGRLRGGVTIAQANARLKLTFAEFHRRFPLFNPKAGFEARPLRETNAGEIRTALMVLFGAVAMVLLIACSNVANLLLARAAARGQEIAVRAAIGASRRRLIAQMLTECFLLAAPGGLLGLAVGQMGLRVLLSLNPEAIPGGAEFAAVSLDWRVLCFTAAISLGTTLVCGLLPALRASRVDLAAAMQAGGARVGSTSHGMARAKSLLVVVQVAAAVVLVAGAGLMIKSFAALRQVEPGIDSHRILTMQMSLQGTKFQDTASVTRLVDGSVRALQAVPGVLAAASTWTLPVELAFSSTFVIEGRQLGGGDLVHGPTLMRPVSPNYAKVFGVPVKRGRFFTVRDTGQSQRVAVVSEAMARKFWPDGNPLGKRITLDKYMGPDFAAPPREIVGVAADVRDEGLHKEPAPMVYIPQAQVPNGMTRIDTGILPITWAVRTEGDPYTFSAAVQRQLGIASGGLAVGRVRSMDDVVKHSTARSGFTAILLTTFAGVALLLAAAGIHGLIAYSVQQRAREMGIRLALGATPRQVRSMVMRQGLALAVSGAAIGAAGSVALARYMQTLLYGVKPADPGAILASSLILGTVALLAAYLPARRAARLDPVEVLRSA